MDIRSVCRVLVLGLLSLGSVRAAAAQDAVACDGAGAAAEVRHGVPSGLLRAIGRVESGRRDPASGRVSAWPWAINAEGRGRLFDSAAEALAGVRGLQQGGVASIDVGCFQINLVHHRTAFATLEEGFDPERNADYAARFLVSLREKTGSWEAAVGAYHSATPERGGPYRDKVLAGWAGGGLNEAGAARPVAAAAPPPAPMVVRMVNWTPLPGGGMRVWGPSSAGSGPAVISMTGRRG